MRTHINLFRIIAYIVQFVLCIIFYDALRNHFFLILLAILIVAPVLDILALIFLWRGLSFELIAPESRVTRMSPGFLRLRLSNSSIFVSFDVKVHLITENTFYKEKGETIIVIPARARGDFQQDLPLTYQRNGVFHFLVDTIAVRDLLGFINLKKTVNASAEVTTYPNVAAEKIGDLSDMSKGMTESEETVKKGHDFSDVSDVREYIPGDKLMSIHWKLSAKRDILMVKDRVSMSDQQMVILTELSGRPEEVDETISLTYGVVKSFIQEQIFVRLMWWSETNGGFEERQIMNAENLRDAFTSIYYETTYSDFEKTKMLMQSIRPELKAYVRINFRDGEAKADVVEQD